MVDRARWINGSAHVAVPSRDPAGKTRNRDGSPLATVGHMHTRTRTRLHLGALVVTAMALVLGGCGAGQGDGDSQTEDALGAGARSLSAKLTIPVTIQNWDCGGFSTGKRTSKIEMQCSVNASHTNVTCSRTDLEDYMRPFVVEAAIGNDGSFEGKYRDGKIDKFVDSADIVGIVDLRGEPFGLKTVEITSFKEEFADFLSQERCTSNPSITTTESTSATTAQLK
jgi:hypothetical protein